MASNEYNDMAELIKDYYDVPVGTYLNQSISINSVTLACDIYRVEPETILTPSVFTGCTAVDANTQIVIGKNMSVASGTTLTPPYRCKGIVIGDVGTFTNEGTISMTARGASGTGKNIQLTTSYMISAVGGAGGTAKTNTGSAGGLSVVGNDGSSPSSGILSCGGGGSGALGPGWNNTGTVTSGSGGSGTSFSGGAGGGGNCGDTRNTAGNGSSTGGGGGNAARYNDGTTFHSSTGGAGNPKGTNITNAQTFAGIGNGTGGLLIIISDTIINNGNLQANGIQADYIPSLSSDHSVAYGGSSGGGCVVLLSRNFTDNGTKSASGGVYASSGIHGGAGGAGVCASYIVEDLILQNLPVEIAITDTNHLDNIEPSEGVRLLGMMDDDELYYDIMGTRHRAMNTDVDLSVIHAPGTRTPDEFEVTITDPQEGQVMRYNATTEQWENGDDYHVYSTNERVVGKWIDGKAIYERVITGTTGNCTTDGITVAVNINLGVLVDKFLPRCSAMININGANVLDNKVHQDSAVTDTSSPNISNHTHKVLGFYCTYRDNSSPVSSKNSVDVNINRIVYSGRPFIVLLQYTKV